jgi:multidrug resistance efflux pump
MVNVTDSAIRTPGPAFTPATAPAANTPATPPRQRGAFLGKLRVRLVVLAMIVGAVWGGLQVAQLRAHEVAQLDIGTVTLTAQAIPVETLRSGTVSAVSVQAQQRVAAGQRLGTAQVLTTNSQGVPELRAMALVAPTAGIISTEPLPVGSTVQPGEPFVEMYDPSRLTLVSEVKVDDLTKIAPGMAATLQADGLPTVDATVQRVLPRVSSADGSGTPAGSHGGRLRVVMVPTRPADVAQLVPGLRFSGTVDTNSAGGDRSGAYVR